MVTITPPSPAPVDTTVTAYRLSTQHRCDACGAQAYIAATVSGTELLFCAHHGRKYETKLRAAATSWHDESARLLEEQSRANGTKK
jgi:hypothetical protein